MFYPKNIACALALVVAAVCAAASYAADPMTPLDIRQVKVGGEIGRRIDVTIQNNLLVLDADGDFLAPFRARDKADGYIGLGKLIDAAVRLAAYSGDEKVLALKRRLVDEALKTREPDGYIGLLKPDARVFALWDTHEMGYLILGLTDDYRFSGERKSLDGAKRLADFVIARWGAEPDRKPGGGDITVHMAVTGIESAMLALSDASGDPRYRQWCIDFRKLPEWQARIAIGRWGQIEGHAYAHMCRCIAQLRLDRLQPDQRLLGPSRDVIDFLTRHDGLVVTGTCGDHECWHDTQSGTVNLGETCTVAYLIRFLDELTRIEGNLQYGDLIERAVLNALFAAQSPDGRKLRYYTPFDGPRQYFPTDTYCCPCNYRRIVAELPGMIYYRSQGGIAVNLYTASSAQIDLDAGLKVAVRQETDYPKSGRVVLAVDPSKPAEFPVTLRMPRWCTSAKAAVSGDPAELTGTPGTPLVIKRTWKPGDRITLDLPMELRMVKGRKSQSGRVAVMRGPVVYTLNRGRHPELANLDLRLITIKPDTLEGPIDDDTVRPGGTACRVQAWSAGKWYPMEKPDLKLTLTEYADPAGEFIYFHVPNPNETRFVDDELVAGKAQ